MAEVGVLNLTIHDNSEEAATGLNALAGALSKVGDASKDFSLDNVNRSVAGIVAAAKDEVKVVEQLGKMFNAIASFGKLKSFSIDTKQFDNLKKSLNGMSIGYTGTQLENIRKAVNAPWDTDNMGNVMSGMNTIQSAAAGWKQAGTAETITDVAIAIEKFNNASGAISDNNLFQAIAENVKTDASAIKTAASEVRESTDAIQTSIGSVSTTEFKSAIFDDQSWGNELRDIFKKHGGDGSEGLVEGLSSGNSEIENATREMGIAAENGLTDELLISSPSKVMEEYGRYSVEGYIQGLQEKTSEVQDATSKMAQAAIAGVSSSPAAANPGAGIEEIGESARLATADIYRLAQTYKDMTNDELASQLQHVEMVLEECRTHMEMLSEAHDRESMKTDANANVLAYLEEKFFKVVARADEFQQKVTYLTHALDLLRDKSEEVAAVTEKTDFVKVDNADQSVAAIERVNNAIEDQIRIRKQNMAMSDQERLEKNYSGYRELFLSGEGNWKNQVPEMYGFTPKALEEGETYAEALEITMREVNEYVDHFIEKMNAPVGHTLSDALGWADEAKLAMKDAAESASVLKNAKEDFSNVTDVGSTFQGMSSRMAAAKTETRVLTDEMEDLDKELKRKKVDVDEVKTGFQRLKDSLSSAKGAIKGLFSPLTKLGKQFYNIARRMMIRAVIRQFTQGIKTGLENVYNYSKAIKSQFATSMDDAASSLLTMKNSLGAALAPALQALIPILQTVVNWFINMMNYVNQFIALINGQNSWIKAVPATTTAFGKEEKAAKKAGNAIKDLLADWDELNIIQSESGGSGSGAGETDAEKALKMFETMNTFDQKVQEVVAAIKENFDSILGLVGDIGLAIGMWKVASGLTGILSTLAYIVGAGAIVVIEFKISEFLNRKFFETGEDGYLIASALTALVGGFFMKGMLRNVLNGQIAQLAIPLSLVVDATTRTIVELGETDVSALSMAAIKANIVSALEVGGAGAYLLLTSGFGAGAAIGGGAALAITTFGVLTNLKADINSIKNGAVSGDTIKEKALGSLILSIGAGMAAKLLVPGATMAQAMGFGVATGASLFLLTMSALIGVQATTKAVNSGITEDVIYDDLKSSLSAGVGSAIIIKMITGKTWLMSSAAGAGVALVVASALVGIQATIDSVKNDSLTLDLVIEDATASLLAGGGIALIGGTLCGLGAGAALTVGGLAALAVFAALIGIQAIIQTVKGNEGIKWGNISLTEQQIQDFVNEKMFTVNVPTVASLIGEGLNKITSTKADVETQLTKALGTFNVIKLGVANDNDYQTLAKEILGDSLDGNGGLVGKVQSYIDSAKAMGKLTLQFSPTLVGEDQTDASSWFTSYTTGWDAVNAFVSDKGQEIGKLLTTEEGKAIIESKPEILAALMEQVQDVTNAITGAKISSEAFANLNVNLGDLDKASNEKILSEYTKYIDQLREKERALVIQQYTSQGQLVAGLIAMGSDPNEEPLKSALAAYEYMGQHINEAIEEGVSSAAEPGRKMLNEYYKKLFSLDLSGIKTTKDGKFFFDEVQGQIDLILGYALANGADDSNIQYNLKKVFDEILRTTFGDNYQFIKQALDYNILDYTDLFGNDTVEQIVAQFKDEKHKDRIRKAWQDMLKDTIGESSETPTVEAAVEAEITVENGKEIQDIIDNAFTFTKKKIDIPATPVVEHEDEKPSVVEEVAEAIDETMKRNLPSNWPAGGGGGANLMLEYDKYTHWLNGPVGGNLYRVDSNGTTPTYYGGVSGFNGAGEGDVSGDVQKGMQETNDTIRNGNDETNRLLRLILAKNFQLNLNPTSGWGFFNQRSNDMAGEVTGYNA